MKHIRLSLAIIGVLFCISGFAQNLVLTYNADEMKASYAYCEELGASEFNWTMNWGEMMYDIQQNLGITQTAFESNYQIDGYGNSFNQYYLDGTSIKLCECTGELHKHANDALGIIAYRPNLMDEEASVIVWDVTAEEMLQYINNLNYNTANLPRYIKFNKVGAIDGPDAVYICIVPSGLTINPHPQVIGLVNWNNQFNKKNDSYWYAKNANPSYGEAAPKGYDEIHANVLLREDTSSPEWQSICKTLNVHLSDVFSNTGYGGSTDHSIITINNEALNRFITIIGEIRGKDLTALSLEFAVRDDLGNTAYTGNDGTEYKMAVLPKRIALNTQDNGKALVAYVDINSNNKLDPRLEPWDTVATLEIEGVVASKLDSINHFRIDYHNNAIADALLNYKAHDNLGDDVLNVVVGVKAWYKSCVIPLYDNALSTRFLRPINVFNVDCQVEGASAMPPVINLRDLVRFTDWRDNMFTSDDWSYYNIRAIKPANVASGGKVSDNPNVMTNLNGTFAPLANVTRTIDFTYNDATPSTPKAVGEFGTADSFGTLTYTNTESTVQNFDVWIPIVVTYEWGDVYTTVKIHINETNGNGDDTPQCATPTIAYVNGEVVFSCETEGVEFVYKYAIPNSTTETSGSKFTPNTKYVITVYAKKEGYLNSQPATAEIDISGIKGDVNGDGVVDIADAVKIVNYVVGKIPQLSRQTKMTEDEREPQ